MESTESIPARVLAEFAAYDREVSSFWKKDVNSGKIKLPENISIAEKPADKLAKYRARLISAKDLIERTDCPEAEVIVEGVVRRGEVCNIVAAPKARKSWLVHDLLTALVSGTDWVGLKTTKAKVLLIDNELRAPTIRKRLAAIVDKKRIDPSVLSNLAILPARGSGLKITEIPKLVEGMGFDVIVLDALYRFYPEKFDENNNNDMTKLYDGLDALADKTKCAIFVIHHASKGNQQSKSASDVGSGASSQSRAADSHLVIRPPAKSEKDTALTDEVTVTVLTRSFAPMPQLELRWEYPVWRRKDDPSQCVFPFAKDADPLSRVESDEEVFG